MRPSPGRKNDDSKRHRHRRYPGRFFVELGSFGDDNDLTLSSYTGQTDLNDYTPSVSLSQSGIAFGSNRVGTLTLQKVTWTMSDGQKQYMTTPVDIDFDDLDP